VCSNFREFGESMTEDDSLKQETLAGPLALETDGLLSCAGCVMYVVTRVAHGKAVSTDRLASASA